MESGPEQRVNTVPPCDVVTVLWGVTGGGGGGGVVTVEGVGRFVVDVTGGGRDPAVCEVTGVVVVGVLPVGPVVLVAVEVDGDDDGVATVELEEALFAEGVRVLSSWSIAV